MYSELYNLSFGNSDSRKRKSVQPPVPMPRQTKFWIKYMKSLMSETVSSDGSQ